MPKKCFYGHPIVAAKTPSPFPQSSGSTHDWRPTCFPVGPHSTRSVGAPGTLLILCRHKPTDSSRAYLHPPDIAPRNNPTGPNQGRNTDPDREHTPGAFYSETTPARSHPGRASHQARPDHHRAGHHPQSRLRSPPNNPFHARRKQTCLTDEHILPTGKSLNGRATTTRPTTTDRLFFSFPSQ